MSCIYKYKGKDYTKDEFYSLVSNPSFIQQEQEKIAREQEIQNKLANKQSALTKLSALGLTEAEIKAIIG